MSLVFHGDKLKELRMLAGLSTAELAKKVGCSAVSIQSWERGAFPPRPKFVKQLAKIFKIATRELYREGEAVEA